MRFEPFPQAAAFVKWGYIPPWQGPPFIFGKSLALAGKMAPVLYFLPVVPYGVFFVKMQKFSMEHFKEKL